MNSEASPEKPTPSVILDIYCDGGCVKNPGGNSGAGVAVYKNQRLSALYHGGFDAIGTNNIAELKGLLHALRIAAEHNGASTVYADSKYAIDCISTWAYGWKKAGWSKKGGEIKNLDLIKEAHFLYDSIKAKVQIRHVRGHSGIEGNELADRMSMEAIRTKNTEFAQYGSLNVASILKMRHG